MIALPYGLLKFEEHRVARKKPQRETRTRADGRNMSILASQHPAI
jgi:hypothetical protein